MDVFMARQPIFKRNLQLFGYELLFRKSERNFYEGQDDAQSTIALINNSFLVFDFASVVDGTIGFLNFPASLLESDLMYALPSHQVIIEILERIEVTPKVIAACQKLKAKGFRLAIDDFVIEEHYDSFYPLLDIVDIVKVDFMRINDSSIQKMIQTYKEDIDFLAEKVETMEDYEKAKRLGFTLFQGYFFSRPLMVKGTEIGYLNANILMLIKEIEEGDGDFNTLASIISRDVGLSYKLLKMANYIYYGAKHRIVSVKHAVIHIGLKELNRWCYLMLLRGIQRPENEVLVNVSVVRGKMLSLMAAQTNSNEFDLFATGIFSSIDVLLNDQMEDALKVLYLSDDVKEALLGKPNRLRRYLEVVMAFERADWDSCAEQLKNETLSLDQCTEYYMASLEWQHSLRD